jgi:ABC-type transport system involved in cytochrome c biogenesis permease subunit
VSARQTLAIDGAQAPAIRWLAGLLLPSRDAREPRVFRIDHPEVRALIGQADSREKAFTASELAPHLEEVERQARLAFQVDSKEWSLFQRRVVALHEHAALVARFPAHDLVREAPPPAPGGEWGTLADVGRAAIDRPLMLRWGAIFRAHEEGDAAAFDRAVADYAALVAERAPGAASIAGFEATFNRLEPFYLAIVLYVLVFILASLSWLGRTRLLVRAACGVLALALVIHTGGLVARVYLMGRPPVTNLYSSAIFIGWGAALFSAGLERLFRNSLGLVAAATIGFTTLLVAQGLSTDGDTMAMLQAVLDTNFWLATHVVVVTLGYASTFLAGLLAILYIVRGALTTTLDREAAKSMQQMVYGVVCFSILFSFVGTILGGLWADQSWGRFWGWDPKENGALLIVLWNAIVLHARWGGLVKQRGLMVLAVFGNVVTAWSWFGTNMLGVGLHSYGFMESALVWLAVFMVTQLAIMGVGILPLGLWRSGAALGAASPAPRPITPEPVPLAS